MEPSVTAPAEDKRARERERARARYAYLKSGCRCVCCTKQDENTLNGRSLCSECTELRKDRREYLKGRCRCVRCTKQDAYTINGHSICAECTELRNEGAKRYQTKNRERVSERNAERYRTRKELGLCPQCGRSKDHNGKSPFCKRCKAMRRNTDRKNYGSPYLRCKWCDNMPAPGRAYCQECLDKLARKKKEWWDSVKKAENTMGSRGLSAFRP